MTKSASGRMTLRDRRKVNEEEVTPPPTVSRRGRGTPRGKPGGPSTPIARKAVMSRFVTPPHSDYVEEMDTPTAAPHVVTKSEPSAIPSLPVRSSHHLSIDVARHQPIPIQPPTATENSAHTETQTESQTQANKSKIMLRFIRPSPLPPAELASLPSPITPLPPSQSFFPSVSQLGDSASATTTGSMAQRAQSIREEGDYLNAREIPQGDEGDRHRKSPKLPGAFVS